jgi:hypothetical protein
MTDYLLPGHKGEEGVIMKWVRYCQHPSCMSQAEEGEDRLITCGY